MKGMVLKSFTLKPTKPNSGNRKVCKVRLANGAVRIGKVDIFLSDGQYCIFF